MFRFHNTDNIDVVGLTEQEEHSFYYYCMGIIKFHLDKCVEKGLLFGVTYYYGGCGTDGFEIYLKEDPDVTITFGLANGDLGYNSMISGEHGVVGSFVGGMKKTVFTVQELEKFLDKTIVKMFEKENITELIDKDVRAKKLAEYSIYKI